MTYYDEQRRRLGTASSAKKRSSLNYPPSAGINQNATDQSQQSISGRPLSSGVGRPQSAPRYGPGYGGQRIKIRQSEEHPADMEDGDDTEVLY